MTSPADFRELLCADLALLRGQADARQVAAALLRYWDRRDRTDTDLAGELAGIAGITDSELEALRAEVAGLVDGAGGDARLALTRHGGMAHELHTAISRKDAAVSKQLTQMGAGIRVGLRTLPKDRYLDFMPVGEGGMGIVYWALDTELGRQVAFKVIRPPVEGAGAGVTPPAPVRMRAPDGGTETAEAFEELKARFLQEAWVTGGMEHPGIVPVYELGRTEGGVPYYTMRFVRGQRTFLTAIDEVRERELEDRLALLEPFLKVCDAIAYAHSRGVVHRDIKPANVALGDFGEAIVLDWGLAKLGGRPDVYASRWQAHVSEFRSETEMATLASALGTPGYMAPEAAAGKVDDVDHLADVYSLGVILFEIVTGRLPFAFDSFDDYAARVIGEDPPDARTIDAAVPPGLAEICAGAIARDRARRPTEVADLARAVRTWQKQSAQDREIDVLLAEAEGALTETEGMTVLAMRAQSERAAAACRRVLDLRPGEQRARTILERARHLGETGMRTEAHQAQRLLLRRVGLTALVLVAVLGAAVAWLLEQRRSEAETAREIARREGDRAARHRLRAEEAMGFMTAELREALEPEGRLDVLAQIGEQARAHFASIPLDEETPKGFRQRTRALRQLGEVYLAQGNLPKARSVFEEAVAASDTYAERDASSALARFERDRARVNLARVDHAQGYPSRGKKRLESVVERLAADPPEGVSAGSWAEVRIRALNALTQALHGTSENARARELSERAYRLVGDLQDREDVTTAQRRLAVETALVTAAARFRAGAGDHALRLAEEACSDAARLRGARPQDLTLKVLELRGEHIAAWISLYSSRFEQAAVRAERVVAGMRELVALRPGHFQWRDGLMAALLLLGDARAGPRQEMWTSRELFDEAFELAEALHAHDPSHAGWVTRLVNLCDRRARAVGPDLGAEPEKRLAFRRRAAEFARKLSSLEPANARWRYYLSFTLGTLAFRTKGAEKLRLGREALGHVRYALERIRNAPDVNDFHVSMSALVVFQEVGAPARIAAAQDAFDTLLRVARESPQSYWPQRMLLKGVTAWRATLLEHGAPGRAEARRQARGALAHYKAQAADATPLPPAIANELQGWIDKLTSLEDDEGR